MGSEAEDGEVTDTRRRWHQAPQALCYCITADDDHCMTEDEANALEACAEALNKYPEVMVAQGCYVWWQEAEAALAAWKEARIIADHNAAALLDKAKDALQEIANEIMDDGQESLCQFCLVHGYALEHKPDCPFALIAEIEEATK